MTFEMSDNPQTIKVFNIRADTREFIGAGDAYIPPNTGLPADCTDIAPPETKTGYVAIFDDEKSEWSCVEDHREQTVYDIKTGSGIFISELGPLPARTTIIAPDGDYPLWDGNQWVTNIVAMYTDKAESERQKRLTEATVITADWLIDLQLGIISDEDKESLILWRTYTKLLKELDLSAVSDENSYYSIVWPDKP